MANLFKCSGIALAVVALIGCGGGSSGGTEPAGSPTVTIVASTTSVPANPGGFQPDPEGEFTIPITVRVRLGDGTSPANGTSVQLSIASGGQGRVSPGGDPLAAGSQARTGTTGGTAEFWFTSGAGEGNVTLTASTSLNTGDGTRMFTANRAITVTPNPGGGRLRIEGATDLPANVADVPIFSGSPYISELTITFLDVDGSPGQVEGGVVQASIAAGSGAFLTTLDDPDTGDVNEFLEPVESAGVNTDGGAGTLFVHSGDQAGEVMVMVSAVDAGSGESFEQGHVVEVRSGNAEFLPDSVDVVATSGTLYITADQSQSVEVRVRDANGNPIADPRYGASEYDNVRLSMLWPTFEADFLTGTGAAGEVSGTAIDVQTSSGAAAVTLRSFFETGEYRVRATVDRADNNVENGVQNPLSAEYTTVVSSGSMSNLEIAKPSMEAIIQDRVSTFVLTDQSVDYDPGTGEVVPPDNDVIYSMPVTLHAIDELGNPVHPGTTADFGTIDGPLTSDNPPMFVFSGDDGNPVETVNGFDVVSPPDGFLDDPDDPDDLVVMPGDTIATFGDEVEGQEHHEEVREVWKVLSNTELLITDPFWNPVPGPLDVLVPWVIGQSRIGEVDSQVEFGDDGFTTAMIEFPVSSLGRPVVIWAQAELRRLPEDPAMTLAGDNHRPEFVIAPYRSTGEVDSIVFPGVSPMVINIHPAQIAANTASPVTICLTDGLGVPVTATYVAAAVSGGAGEVSLDGDPLGDDVQDRAAAATGTDGCLTTMVETQDLSTDGDPLSVRFYVGNASADVSIQPPGSRLLDIRPARFPDRFDGPVEVPVTLTLTEPDGSPVPGTYFTFQCSEPPEGGSLEIVAEPGATDAEGRASARLSVDVSTACLGGSEGAPLDAYNCTFTPTGGEPAATFSAVRYDLADLPLLPDPCAE